MSDTARSSRYEIRVEGFGLVLAVTHHTFTVP
jgi:hypothetical protein